MHDHGLFCDACGTVTLFERDAIYPRSCGRCDAVLRAAPPAKPRAWRRERERAVNARREAREARAGRRAA